jgi:CheY-like chemotaxis protein
MDLEMPIMNGFEASLQIKQMPNQYVIAFTSNILSIELIKKLKNHNFDDWFMSPVPKDIIKTHIIEKFRSREYLTNLDRQMLHYQSRVINTIMEENELEDATNSNNSVLNTTNIKASN